MRLIDANALKAKVPNTNVDIFENCRNCSTLMDWQVKELIDKQPTIDAVEVVRCGECERRYKPLDDDVRNEIYCEFIGSTMRKDDFCSYGCADGKRKEKL